jgi:RNA polymerase sigma-70 factor (ECF subfamily)
MGAAEVVFRRLSIPRDATQLREDEKLGRFEQAVLPHLEAAYNLARWLTRNDHDAEDVVQEAFLRAYQFFAGFHGTDGRAWLLATVRNTCYTWLERNRAREPVAVFDEEKHGAADSAANPLSRVLQSEDRQLLRQAVEALPAEYREVIVLRELEGLSYKDIAAIVDVPLGTVMSRLARARDRLQQGLVGQQSKGP